jgi:hypothetical protein
MRTRLLAPLITALLSMASGAHAYCRTTTETANAGFDPSVKGTCPAGTPLAWPSMPVAYQIFRGAGAKISLAEATPIIDRAFARWPTASCSPSDSTARPALSVVDLGPTDAADPCLVLQNGKCALPTDVDALRKIVHGIYFRDDAWPYTDAYNTLALTTVSYGVDTGHIFAAVMELNSHEHNFSTSSSPDAGSYSLETVITHEAGHFLGMAHSPQRESIMYAFYHSEALELTNDDAAGICTAYSAYPQVMPANSACSAATGRATDEIGLGLAFAGLVVGAGVRRRRRAPAGEAP